MSAIRHTWGVRDLGLAGGLALLVAGCSFDTSAAGGGPNGDGDDTDPIADASVNGEPDAPGTGDDAGDSDPEPDAMPDPVELTVPLVTTAPTIDGLVDAVWDQAEEVVFDFADAELELSAPHPVYEPSVTATFRLLHDADTLYLLVEIDDDVPGVIEIDDNIFTDDGVGFFFDGAGDLTGPSGADDHTVIINASRAFEHYGSGFIVPDRGHQDSAGGYVGEYAIPKSELEIGAGGTIGFNLALFDNDDLGGPDIDAAGLWKLPDGPRCETCCLELGEPRPWCDTTMLVPVALEQP